MSLKPTEASIYFWNFLPFLLVRLWDLRCPKLKIISGQEALWALHSSCSPRACPPLSQCCTVTKEQREEEARVLSKRPLTLGHGSLTIASSTLGHNQRRKSFHWRSSEGLEQAVSYHSTWAHGMCWAVLCPCLATSLKEAFYNLHPFCCQELYNRAL